MAAREYDTLLDEPKADTASSMYNNTDPALFTNVVHPSPANAGDDTKLYCGGKSWFLCYLGFPCIYFCPIDERPRSRA